MDVRWIVIRSILLVFCTLCSQAQVYYVCAPNALRVDSSETIAVALEDGPSSMVKIFVQDHPGKRKNISETEFQITAGNPEVVKIPIYSVDLPSDFLKGPETKYVSLNVHSGSFIKELIVPLNRQSGYIFIQTDKPIYTPKQRVQLRVIPLGEDGLPSDQLFTLQIKNPQNLIVEEVNLTRKTRAFLTHIYKFPNYPALGEWSATVRYGHQQQQNATVHFDVQKYVLPTFTVELKTPEVILPTDRIIEASVTAKYVYGRMVKGLVTFKLGVKGETPKTTFFATVGPKQLEKGMFRLQISVEELRLHKNVGWFPEIAGSRLVVEATVVDDASGNKENATDTRGRFSNSPYIISFDRSLKDFKPGLKTVFQADIRYVDNRPAPRVPLTIKAKADGQEIAAPENGVSDENGKFHIQLQPEMTHSEVTLTLQTSDPKYGEHQATGSHVQRKFQSPKNAYIALERSGAEIYKPGDTFNKIVHLEPDGIANVYYLVKSRNRILETGKLRTGRFKVQHLEFKITYDMTPSFRVLIFAHHEGELLADSLKIDVEKFCRPESEVSLQTDFPEDAPPGDAGKIILKGTRSTLVGLLGVDEAVYALSKKDLLTKDKMFEAFSRHDLGCGPGGGLNTNVVLANTGVLMSTNFYSPGQSISSCAEVKRRKREIASEITSSYTGMERQCCTLGIKRDNYGRTCEQRTAIVQRYLGRHHEECSRAFLRCCLDAKDRISARSRVAVVTSLGRMGGFGEEEMDFVSIDEEEDVEKDVLVRRDFKETWIFHDITIGAEERAEVELSLPHSITTWVLRAVSVHPSFGMCVLDPPAKVVSFKKLFLQLHLPYSVVRNEQVEVRATLFNYGNIRIRAVVYMYGVKNLCTGTEEGEKSERKRVVIEPHSAVSVPFPIVPLREGTFPLKVVALTSGESDVIQKDLHVVPEGVTKEFHIPITLDPMNRQKRKDKRHVKSEFVSDFIDQSQNLQVTAIELRIPEDFVPGTESCSITALGDQFGPTVETALNDPGSLIQRPRGCGEQNMIFLAPTLYTMRYLKVTGKMTAENEQNGYAFIRQGYGHQLSFRKADGSYAAYQQTPTSTWLTAFVMKVFCQASEMVHIDEHVLCGGIEWLINHQQPDGSYLEARPVYHVDMMGGVEGKVPLTAFCLIALEECTCDKEKLNIAKSRALAFIEAHLHEVVEPLPVAVVAYALSLSNSELKKAANDKLMSMAHFDEDTNTLHWKTSDSARDIEAAAYGLLNQLLLGDMNRAMSIVNWLNTKRLQSGAFQSTQDTVMALQALAEYAIAARAPPLNLKANISSNNDRHFQKVLSFNDGNAELLQKLNVDKVGGTIFIKTTGQGVGSMAVKLRYNILKAPEKICKFQVVVNVTSPDKKEEIMKEEEFDFDLMNPRRLDVFEPLPNDLIRGVASALDINPEAPVLEEDPRDRGKKRATLNAMPNIGRPLRVRREDQVENSQGRLKISICSRYLGDKDAGMSIVDAGLFTGFEPEEQDLKDLQDMPQHLIERYEKSKRGVVFYLKKVPMDQNYCFSFHVRREYFVSKPQASVIKVYDYYNPDASCTVFYSPENNSPRLRTFCEGGVCQCAEGGCPPKSPFSQVKKDLQEDMRAQLLQLACDKYDFVWKGQSEGDEIEGGFRKISFRVDTVVKEGMEKREIIEGEVKDLLVKENCETAVLIPGATYLLMSKDGQKYMNDKNEIWHRYLLGNSTAIHLWTSIRVSPKKELQKALKSVVKTLNTKGCNQ
ncbi:ophiophagus venom factor-like [Uloborus diversus]|uniref:ophiophagus venom factor-like n=1 Tax=Uloborus diversus TaxID=327109 RepID=UPI0024091B2D|nr:ophiophagus venom factor-like [Uloborus diversus]